MAVRIQPVYVTEAKCVFRGKVAWKEVYRAVGNALSSRVARICLALRTILESGHL